MVRLVIAELPRITSDRRQYGMNGTNRCGVIWIATGNASECWSTSIEKAFLTAYHIAENDAMKVDDQTVITWRTTLYLVTAPRRLDCYAD